MNPIVRRILPFVIANFVLIAVALVLVFTGHHTAGIVVMLVDAGNIMFLRYRMFRWQRERRGR